MKEVHSGKSGKHREGGRKETGRFLRSLYPPNYTAYYPRIYSFSVPCYVCNLSKGLLQNLCSVLLLLFFSLKSCFQFYNNAFNQARVLKADVQRDLIFHSLYAHTNTHACTGIFYANVEQRGIYLAAVDGAEY
jgi:hypothetical protein